MVRTERKMKTRPDLAITVVYAQKIIVFEVQTYLITYMYINKINHCICMQQ